MAKSVLDDLTDDDGKVNGFSLEMVVTVACELIAGFIFWHYCVTTKMTEHHRYDHPNEPKHPRFIRRILKVFAAMCSLMQFAPLTLHFLYGSVSCERGTPEMVHIIYAGLFATAAPLMGSSHVVDHFAERGRYVLLSKLHCPLFIVSLFVYVLTLLFVYNSYTDGSAAAIAEACKWDKAPVPIFVMFQGLAIQIAVAAINTGREGVVAVLLNYLPDTLERDNEFTADDQRAGDATAAAARIMKFLSVQLPQAFIQVWLKKENGESSRQVYASLALSIGVGSFNFCYGVWRMNEIRNEWDEDAEDMEEELQREEAERAELTQSRKTIESLQLQLKAARCRHKGMIAQVQTINKQRAIAAKEMSEDECTDTESSEAEPNSMGTTLLSGQVSSR